MIMKSALGPVLGLHLNKTSTLFPTFLKTGYHLSIKTWLYCINLRFYPHKKWTDNCYNQCTVSVSLKHMD